MTRQITITITALIIVFTVNIAAKSEPNSNQTLSFANHLFDTGDYYRAITEYQRYLFITPKSAKTDFVNLKIALAYLEGKELDIAFESLDQITHQPNNSYAETARLRLAGGLYADKQYNNAITTISAAPHLPGNRHEIDIFLGLCQLHNGNLQQAETYFLPLQNNKLLTKELLNACNQYRNIPQKKKWLAGTLSALLPGSGQLYVKRPHDAAWAFLLNSIFLSATYYAFENDETVAGIFAASLEVVWYTGNIYNAANGAHKYNQHQENIFFHDLEEKTIYNQEKPIYQLFFRVPL